MNSKKQTILFNIAIVVISTFMSVLFVSICGEIYLHYFPVNIRSATPHALIDMWLPDPEIGFINKPGFEFDSKYWWGCEEKLTSKGTRGKDFPAKKPKDTYRILGIGDSITFGVVNCNDKTFLSKLENKLNASSEKKKFEVINAGVIGYSTLQEYLFLLKYGINWNPDMVIITICPNDRTCSVNPFNTAKIVPTSMYVPQPPHSKKKTEQTKVNKTKETQRHKKKDIKWSFSLSDSKFYNFTASVVKKQLLRFGWVTRNADYKWAIENKTKRRYRYFDLLSRDAGEFEIFSEIIKLCKERGIELIVTKIPAITDIARDLNRDPQIINYFKKNNVGYLDFYEIINKTLYKEKFMFLYKPELYLSNDRLHMNEKGHSLIAESLYKIVKHKINNDA